MSRRAFVTVGGLGVASAGLVMGLERLVGRDPAGPQVNFAPAVMPRSDPPTPAGGLTVAALTPGSVTISWAPAFDDELVTSQVMRRDGELHDHVPGDVNRYTDTRATPGETHRYALVSLDGDGNETPARGEVQAEVPAALFLEDFESDLDSWELSGLAVVEGLALTGSRALVGATQDGRASATWRLPSPASVLNCQIHVRYDEKEQDRSLNVLRLRGPRDEPLCGLFVSPTGRLGVRNDVGRVNLLGGDGLEPGRWHCLWIRLEIGSPLCTITAGTAGVVDPALDRWSQDLGSSPIGSVQLGEPGPARRFRMHLDRLVLWS